MYLCVVVIGFCVNVRYGRALLCLSLRQDLYLGFGVVNPDDKTRNAAVGLQSYLFDLRHIIEIKVVYLILVGTAELHKLVAQLKVFLL